MRALVALSLMLGGCAYHSETMPPPQYQAIGTTTVAFSDDPATDCNMGNAVACTLGAVIIVPNPCIWANEFYASLLCHENAHRFGGWRHEKK